MNLDNEIIKLIKKMNKPLSTNTIAVMLNRHRRDVHERLKSLSKFKKVRKVTTQKVDFWWI